MRAHDGDPIISIDPDIGQRPFAAVVLTAAILSRARSAERTARAAWAALRLLAAVAIGATMELGRGER